MYVLGLTGSIGMGKTWGATCFRLRRIPVHAADQAVHDLMAPHGRATALVEQTFPGVLDQNGGIDRQKLAAQVLGDDGALDKLEAILHPLVREDQRRFLERCQRRRVKVAVLDIPLLYETQARTRVDGVVVMSAPVQIQRQRVLRRAGMTVKKLDAILARQLDNNIKCQLAEFVVSTGATRGESLRQISAIAKVAKRLKGRVWGPHWGR